MTLKDMKTFIAVSIAAHALVLTAASLRLPGLYGHSGNNGQISMVSLVDGGASTYSGGRARPKKAAIKPRNEAAVSVKTEEKRIETDAETTVEGAADGSAVATGNGSGEAAAARGAPSSPSGGRLAPFRDMVRARIEAAKFYPLFARQRGYEGVVGVRFFVDIDGSVKDVVVVSPCHCDALNRAACEAVKRAAPLPAPPEMVTMEVDLSYRLE